MPYDTSSPYIEVQEYRDGELKWVQKKNPYYRVKDDARYLALAPFLPLIWIVGLARGLADPHSRPTYLRWGAILLFLTLGVPLLFGLGSLIVVTILKPHMMLSHLPELWAAIQHAL
jgi:hypothetical protein